LLNTDYTDNTATINTPSTRSKTMLEFKQTVGKATLYRRETYNHRTTPLVEWIVKVGDRTIRECATRKEALTWLDIYKD